MIRLLTLALATIAHPSTAQTTSGPIQPYSENPYYWEYRGEPILLVGASVVDNLHNWHDLAAHLSNLQANGVNYLRVSLSMGTRGAHGGDDRPIEHDQPFLRFSSRRYDLTQPDPVYWQRLETLLTLAQGHGMIVELELFNRFDYWRGFWEANAWNPRRNINYTEEEAGLAPIYNEHPAKDMNPFFHSVPEMNNNRVLLGFQTSFVDRVLDLTLGFENILYTINNETSTNPAWGRHWIEHVEARADAAGREVYVTDMFDSHQMSDDPFQTFVAARGDVYEFVSAAQLTSMMNSAADQRAEMAWLRAAMADAPRPITISKIYGSDGHILTDFRRREFQRYGDEAGLHSFWMSLLSGASAVRFHRDAAGLGPSEAGLASIRSARLLSELVPLWEMEPADELLSGGGDIAVAAGDTELGRAFTLPEAHAMAHPGGESFVVFLTRGGEVGINVGTSPTDAFDLHWIDIATGMAAPAAQIPTDQEMINLMAPGNGPWLAVITVPMRNED